MDFEVASRPTDRCVLWYVRANNRHKRDHRHVSAMLPREPRPPKRRPRRAAAGYRVRTLRKRQTIPNRLTQDFPASAGSSPRSGRYLRENQLMYAWRFQSPMIARRGKLTVRAQFRYLAA